MGFKFYYNPAVWLIWAGGGLLVFGALFSLWPRARAAQHSEEERALATLAELELDYQSGKVSEAEYQALYAELSPKAKRLLEREELAVARVVAELRSMLEAGAPGGVGGGPGTGAGRGLAILLLTAALVGSTFFTGPAWAQQATVSPAAQEGPMGPGVAIPRETLVLRWQDGRLWVLDLVTVTNVGDDVVSEVQLPLAPGAEGVTFDGDELEVVEDAAWDRRPLAPERAAATRCSTT